VLDQRLKTRVFLAAGLAAFEVRAHPGYKAVGIPA
jgi:hypothetical protein